MVTASRKHLTKRYASGVDLLLWETEKRLIPDLDAIKSVAGALSSGQAEGLDMGAALVLVQAARLGLDRLEYQLFEGAHAMGMGSEALAAVLDLPDAAAADKRHRWLRTRRALPYAADSAEAVNRAETSRPQALPPEAARPEALRPEAARAEAEAARAEAEAARAEALRPGAEHAVRSAAQSPAGADDTAEQLS
jgi:hypothetical protein